MKPPSNRERDAPLAAALGTSPLVAVSLIGRRLPRAADRRRRVPVAALSCPGSVSPARRSTVESDPLHRPAAAARDAARPPSRTAPAPPRAGQRRAERLSSPTSRAAY